MAYTLNKHITGLLAAALLSVSLTVPGSLAGQGAGLPEQFQLITPQSQMQTLGTFSFDFNQSLRNASVSDLRIHEAGLTLDSGTPVSAYDYAKAAGLVIGAGEPVSHVSITSVTAVPRGLEVMAMFQSGFENYTPHTAQLGVWDLHSFQQLDWDFIPASNASKKAIGAWVLTDVSGSMADMLETVKQAASQFFAAMPPYLDCSLIGFADSVQKLSPNPEDCRQAGRRVSQLTLGGATNLFGALQTAYEEAAQGGYKHALFIVLSDGMHYSGQGTRQGALDAKKKVSGKTLILWTGQHDKSDLSNGLADWEMEAGSDPKTGITDYFQNLQLFVEGQRLIQVRRPALSLN